MRMQCRTKNSDAKLGAYYNALENRMIKNGEQIIGGQRIKLCMSPICRVIDGRELNTELLFNILRVHQRRQLRLLLNPADRVGVEASIEELSNSNKNTRFLYYMLPQYDDILVQSKGFLERIAQWIKSPSDATDHGVSVTHGIEFLLVLEMSSNERSALKVDQTLENIQNEMMKNNPNLKNVFQYQKLLSKTGVCRTYSNLASLKPNCHLSDLVQEINASKRKLGKTDLPLYCNLRPIEPWLYMSFMDSPVKKYQSIVERFEDQLLKLAHRMHDSCIFWNKDRHELMGKNFQDTWKQNYDEYDKLLKTSIMIVEQGHTLSRQARYSLAKYFELNRFVRSQELKNMEDELKELGNRMKPIWKTEELIIELELSRIAYIDVSNYLSETDTSLACVRRKLLNDQIKQIIICSEHNLNRQCLDRWVDTCAYFMKKRNENTDLHVTYADFSFSQISLKEILILSNEDCADNDGNDDFTMARHISLTNSEDIGKRSRSISEASHAALNDESMMSCQSSQAGMVEMQQNNEFTPISRRNSSSTSTDDHPSEIEDLQTTKLDTSASEQYQYFSSSTDNPRPPEETSMSPETSIDPQENYTNILLVGESGVGKSTFINAIANYLRFSSLEDAMQEPIVIIPVSFLITTGINFDEKIVTFDKCENRENERFNERGQSVTQECQEYKFDVPFQGGTKRIRIIDTPGFGDTRGVEQDQKNVAHIKQYIHPYKSLDAICFLLKPNESRLNIAFRSCFIQFLSVLGEANYHKLIFCFTNARSTFYAPGNSGPLLREMLSNRQVNNISLKKQNTFCFDNESFRYLVAIRNHIQFGQEEQEQYAKSWKISVKEATRLLEHILNIHSMVDLSSP